mgnify:CR=1 FL=1
MRPFVIFGEMSEESGGGDGTGRSAADVLQIGKIGFQLLFVFVEQRQLPGAVVGALAGIEQLANYTKFDYTTISLEDGRTIDNTGQEADAADRRADELETRAGGVRSAARSAGLRNASAEGFDRLVQRINNGAATPVQPAAASAAGGVTYTSTAGTSPVLQAGAGQIINELA